LSNDTNDSGLLQTTQTQSQIVVNASLQGVADVFGKFMSYAVRKITVPSDGTHVLKAAVTMEFPDFNLVDCAMMLEISPDYVEHLVRDLFGIKMETVRGVRHLLLDRGVRLTSNTSNPEITLKGVQDSALLSVFGAQICEKIKASKMGIRELQEGKLVTECVSMILMSRSGEGAYINICLDLKGGLEIKSKLYS
jgi:hypothetical protein